MGETATEKLCREARENVNRIARERNQLDQQVEALLQVIDDVKRGGLDPGHPQSARSRMFAAADQVRKEREQ